MKIGMVARFQNGYAFKSKDFSIKGNYRIVKIKELKDGKIKFYDDSKFISINDISRYEKYLVNKNDILFALTGDPVNRNNPLSWVGRVSIYQHDIPALINQRVCKLIPGDNINAKYIYYYFRDFKNLYALASIAKGSASQANISTKDIENFDVVLPSLENQNKVIAILDSIEKKINNNISINNNLENQLHLYYRMLFKENPKDNWKLGNLEDLGKIIGGGTPSKKVSQYYSCDGIPWITPKDLSKNQSKFIARGATDISEEGLNNSSAVLMPKGSVLFSSRAPIGYIAIAKNKLSTNQGFKSVIPYENFGTTLVYCFLKDNLQIIDSLSSGSTFNEVSTKTMKNIPALIPDIETVSEFRNYADKVLKLQEQFEEQIFKLNTVKEFLLIKLLSGELDVSNIDF